MLRLVQPTNKEGTCVVSVKDAQFPKPFPVGIEFNAPVHGTWNIVHTGMLVPESHQIYACAMNCSRGVVMTAAEMGELDRLSTITITEKDIVYGDLEKQLIEGVTDLVQRMPKRPKLIFLYPVCIHHFLGTNMKYVYRMLEKNFPDIAFAKCFMDPTMQKHALPPDVRLCREMYAGLQKREQKENVYCIIGNNLSYEESSDLKKLIQDNGGICMELAACKSYEQYLQQAESRLNIVTHPNGLLAAKELEKRLNIPYVYLPLCYGYLEIEQNIRRLCQSLETKEPDYRSLKEMCDRLLCEVREQFQGCHIAIDYTFTPRPLGLARLLLEHGISVKRVYLDQINPEEEQDFYWLRENASSLLLIATNHYQMRYPTHRDGSFFALGQKAAYFTGTSYFLNEIEGGGHYGFDGICKLAQNMLQQQKEEKDTENIVPRKGLGCDSLVCCDTVKWPAISPSKQLAKTEQSPNDTKVIMPVYTGDVSGVPSALYEMGGMVIMHDASGCNSTYNTHDELRWYEKPSQIYISGVTEIDAVMGNDEKFIRNVTTAVKDLHPKFIALASSPVPYVNGMDLTAIAKMITKRTEIPCFFVPTNGTHNYIAGVGNAFYEYLKVMVPSKMELLEKLTANCSKAGLSENKKADCYKLKVNVLGITPLDFADDGYEQYVQMILEKYGMEMYSCFSMGENIKNCEKASLADVSLVVSSTGWKAAKYLEERDHIPYVVGTPFGERNDELMQLLQNAAKQNQSACLYTDQFKLKKQGGVMGGKTDVEVEKKEFCVIGEPVMSESLVFLLQKKTGKQGKAFYPMDVPNDLLFDKRALLTEELNFMQKIKGYSVIIADPLLKPLCPSDITFYELPHVACSGRMAANCWKQSIQSLLLTECD